MTAPKRRVGHPNLRVGEPTVRLKVRVPVSLKARAYVRAAEMGMTPSAWARLVWENALAKTPSLRPEAAARLAEALCSDDELNVRAVCRDVREVQRHHGPPRPRR